MNPSQRRFDRKYLPLADAIARLDIDQVVREQVADALTDALRGRPDFYSKMFRLLASDPLTPCAGPGDDEPCPHGREIRIPMHNSRSEDGRSAVWEPQIPAPVRCADCGLAVRIS